MVITIISYIFKHYDLEHLAINSHSNSSLYVVCKGKAYDI